MTGLRLTPQSLDSDEKQIKFYHTLVEVFKFAYGKRSALGDEFDSQTEKNLDIERVNIDSLFLDFNKHLIPVASTYPLSGICYRNS